ncbi:hypothetical protein [Saccharothrix deserti]|uniref:hypothetical protein n=1 Tax=Saccharothrix deserti TaxID=2593674 RepID=UPI00192E3F85|nr:hypothetical protein [Saccharothrix deserti]
MASLDRVFLRDKSQAAFGQRYRLEVMLAIADAEDGFVALTDLAKQLNVTISNLQGPLKSLVTLGLLTPIPHGDSRHRFYLRNPSTAWSWAKELHDQAHLDNAARAADGEGTDIHIVQQ